MKKSLPAVLLVVIAVALAVYYGARVQATRNALSRSGPAARALSPAPSLTMVDLDGNKITSASYAGKVVLVNFWAAGVLLAPRKCRSSWPCRRGIVMKACS